MNGFLENFDTLKDPERSIRSLLYRYTVIYFDFGMIDVVLSFWSIK